MSQKYFLQLKITYCYTILESWQQMLFGSKINNLALVCPKLHSRKNLRHYFLLVAYPQNWGYIPSSEILSPVQGYINFHHSPSLSYPYIGDRVKSWSWPFYYFRLNTKSSLSPFLFKFKCMLKLSRMSRLVTRI